MPDTQHEWCAHRRKRQGKLFQLPLEIAIQLPESLSDQLRLTTLCIMRKGILLKLEVGYAATALSNGYSTNRHLLKREFHHSSALLFPFYKFPCPVYLLPFIILASDVMEGKKI